MQRTELERHLLTEVDRLRADLDFARTGRMMTLAELRAWREADHEDAITLHRSAVIKIIEEDARLRAECAQLEDHINDADDESIRLRADNERLHVSLRAIIDELEKMDEGAAITLAYAALAADGKGE